MERHEAEFSSASASLSHLSGRFDLTCSHHLKRRAGRLLDLQPQPEGRSVEGAANQAARRAELARCLGRFGQIIKKKRRIPSNLARIIPPSQRSASPRERSVRAAQGELLWSEVAWSCFSYFEIVVGGRSSGVVADKTPSSRSHPDKTASLEHPQRPGLHQQARKPTLPFSGLFPCSASPRPSTGSSAGWSKRSQLHSRISALAACLFYEGSPITSQWCLQVPPVPAQSPWPAPEPTCVGIARSSETAFSLLESSRRPL